MRLKYLIVIAVFFAGFQTGKACRFTIREIGYSPLNLETYVLQMETDTTLHNAVVNDFIKIAEGYAVNANIRYRIVQKPGQSVVWLDLLNNRGISIMRKKAGNRRGIEALYHEILFSPLQQTLSGQIGNVFAFMLCFYDRNEKQVNRQVDEAIRQFRKVSPTLDKMVKEEIMKIIVPGKERPSEEVILRSMGINPVSPDPVVMIIYGRGHLVDKPLTGDEITKDRLLRQLVMLGTDCECGIDLSPLLKRAIPLAWNDDMRQKVADMLGFDVDNPMITTEMSKILSKEPEEAANAALSIAPQTINLDQQLGKQKSPGNNNTEETQVTGMRKTFHYTLIITGLFILLALGTGLFILLRKKD